MPRTVQTPDLTAILFSSAQEMLHAMGVKPPVRLPPQHHAHVRAYYSALMSRSLREEADRINAAYRVRLEQR